MRMGSPCLLLSTALLLQSADLPVKEVTLYKHGIGYFERAGTVPAGEEVRLDFKNTDMNDVLKSLIVADTNGGKISGIRYDSNATLEQQLEKYPFHHWRRRDAEFFSGSNQGRAHGNQRGRW